MFGMALKKTERATVSAREALDLQTTIEGNSLFEALNCEFHWTALQIAAVACVMNASIATRRQWILRSCRNLFPVEASVVGVALRSFEDLGLAKDLGLRIERIYLDLAQAKRISEPYVTAASSFEPNVIGHSKLEQLAAFWREMAKESLEAVQQLEPEARWRLSGLYTEIP